MKKPPKIFMIDDDPTMHIYHKIMTKQIGINEETIQDFRTGDSALLSMINIIEKDGEQALPDIVLLDLKLPNKSGWQFIEDIKNLNLKNHLPKIYIITDSENLADRKRAKACPEVIDIKPKYCGRAFYESLMVSQTISEPAYSK